MSKEIVANIVYTCSVKEVRVELREGFKHSNGDGINLKRIPHWTCVNACVFEITF